MTLKGCLNLEGYPAKLETLDPLLITGNAYSNTNLKVQQPLLNHRKKLAKKNRETYSKFFSIGGSVDFSSKGKELEPLLFLELGGAEKGRAVMSGAEPLLCGSKNKHYK